MLLGASGFVLFLLFVFWVWALFDCITTRPELCRNLPKLLWLVLVILLFDIGAFAWLLLGRPPREAQPRWMRSESSSRPPPEPVRDAESSVVTDRRSAELDRQLEAWEAEQARKRAAERERQEPGDS